MINIKLQMALMYHKVGLKVGLIYLNVFLPKVKTLPKN